MEPIKAVLDLFLHLDDHLRDVTHTYGLWTYLLLFAIIFAETGFVVTPFLPGDSLLFAAGAISAIPGSGLNVGLLLVLLFVAAVLGDSVNYGIGQLLGTRLPAGGRSRLLKKEHLDRTHAFFEKHGGKTIILARFVPIVRTFAPFVAGMGSMRYGQFLLYNVVGGALWVGICVGAGYLFGNIAAVREHFELVIFAIILLSLLPIVIETVLHRRRGRILAVKDGGSVR
jgi:membrane-associated protein